MSNTTTQYSFAMQDKTYTSVFTLLSDLSTAITINIQPKLQNNEIAPIFSLNLTELNKINMTIITNSGTFSMVNNGLLFYYLGYNINNVKTSVTSVLLQKTTIFSFQNVYNLSFDTSYNLILIMLVQFIKIIIHSLVILNWLLIQLYNLLCK